jgi:histidine triad (HIT) family protein
VSGHGRRHVGHDQRGKKRTNAFLYEAHRPSLYPGHGFPRPAAERERGGRRKRAVEAHGVARLYCVWGRREYPGAALSRAIHGDVGKMTDCLFCKIASGQIPARMLFADPDVVAFHDINPTAPTHVLVIPRRHIATLDDAIDADAALLGKMIWAARRVALEHGLTAGYRLVMNVHAGAGQVVPHVHLHVLGGRPFSWPPG